MATDPIVISARTVTTGYPAENVLDHWNLKKRFRGNDVATSNYLLHFDLGSATELVAIFLNDVNFNRVRIQGDAADSWTTPDEPGTDITISQNAITGRYQVYIPLTDFQYRYVRIYIPSSASAVGGYTSKWEVGAVCLMTAVTELAENMSWGYSQTARQLYKQTMTTRIKLWETVRWEGRLLFNQRSKATQSDLMSLSRMDMASPMVFYENRGDTSAAYLCVRDDAMEVAEFSFGGVSGSTIGLKEAFMIDS